MMRFAALLVLLLMSSGSYARSDACPKPGEVAYPLGDVLQKAGLGLEFDPNQTRYAAYGSPEHVEENKRTVLGNLDGKSLAERDALLLGRLSFVTIGTIPLLGLTTGPESGLFEVYLEVLERWELNDHHTALQMAKAAFPRWDTTASDRYRQWNSYGIDPEVDARIKAASDRFVRSRPALLDTAEVILRSDPAYEAYQTRRGQVDDWQKMQYLLRRISACVPRTEQGMPDGKFTSELPTVLADLFVLDMLVLESTNGGFHQYLSNSSGDFAADLLRVLRKLGLSQQADDAAYAMALLGEVYPANRALRNARMNRLSKAQNDALNQPTWIVDDDELYAAMIALAKSKGYFPR